MRISHWVVLLPVLAGPAFAQVTAPNCTVSGWDWTSNSLGQSPCYVAASLESTCNGGQFTIPALLSDYVYVGPSVGQNNTCICGIVVYSLASACGGCQGSSWISWNVWSFNCTSVDTGYSNVIPNETRVPDWAYLKLVCFVLCVSLLRYLGIRPRRRNSLAILLKLRHHLSRQPYRRKQQQHLRAPANLIQEQSPVVLWVVCWAPRC